MAYEHGTANGHKDLLAKIKTFVTTNADLVSANQNWTVLNNDPTGNEVYFKAPGLTTKESIYTAIKCHQDAGADYYNFQITASLGYSSSAAFGSQPNSANSAVLLFNHAIPYWMSANGQRLIVVAKVSNIYTCFYLGKFNQYGHPHQYPYPVFVGGAYKNHTARWSLPYANGHRHLQNPDLKSNCFACTPGNVWAKSCNEGYEYNATTKSRIIAQPPIKVGNNPDGSYNLIPFFLVQDLPVKNVLGELDGVYWVSGHNNPSETILNQDGKQYLVFQNISKTDWSGYAALEMS